MSKQITIKNKEGHNILKFENIILKFDDDFKRIIFQICIEFDPFYAKALLDGEEFDLINLREGLYKIYDNKLKSFVFNPIGEQINIYFKLIENGQIEVIVILNNPMFTGKLECRFTTDRSYIPNMIHEIEEALK
jgi:hypothetical protein